MFKRHRFSVFNKEHQTTLYDLAKTIPLISLKQRLIPSAMVAYLCLIQQESTEKG